jgi:hypothetical protein
MMTGVKMQKYGLPEVGDEVCVHLFDMLPPWCGRVVELHGYHLTIELDDCPGVVLVVPARMCTW